MWNFKSKYWRFLSNIHGSAWQRKCEVCMFSQPIDTFTLDYSHTLIPFGLLTFEVIWKKERMVAYFISTNFMFFSNNPVSGNVRQWRPSSQDGTKPVHSSIICRSRYTLVRWPLYRRRLDTDRQCWVAKYRFGDEEETREAGRKLVTTTHDPASSLHTDEMNT